MESLRYAHMDMLRAWITPAFRARKLRALTAISERQSTFAGLARIEIATRSLIATYDGCYSRHARDDYSDRVLEDPDCKHRQEKLDIQDAQWIAWDSHLRHDEYWYSEPGDVRRRLQPYADDDCEDATYTSTVILVSNVGALMTRELPTKSPLRK